MPIGNVFVGNSGGNVKHDDTALALDVVTIPQTTKLLLSSGVPNVEADCAEIGCESQGMNFNTKGCCARS